MTHEQLTQLKAEVEALAFDDVEKIVNKRTTIEEERQESVITPLMQQHPHELRSLLLGRIRRENTARREAAAAEG